MSPTMKERISYPNKNECVNTLAQDYSSIDGVLHGHEWFF